MTRRVAAVLLTGVFLLAGCGGTQGSAHPVTAGGSASPVGSEPAGSPSVSPAPSGQTPAAPPLPQAGNPGGRATVPAEAQPVDTSRPTRVIGTGTPASCTSDAVVAAVAAGGVITFSCGSAPVTITMKATAKVRNNRGPRLVLDGGGKVTLSGGGVRRILYQNTCDKSLVWTTSHCNDQDHPQLTVQNLAFVDGNATGETTDGGGGGAIFVRGGRLKIINSTFLRNKCDTTGPDVGGAAVRVLDQHKDQPVYVVRSTFEHGQCSNGSALSSIGVSWVVLNSRFARNAAIGRGANPARSGQPGGGSGGAIYTDGNLFTVRVAGTVIEHNTANEGGGAIFFVSNNRTGTMTIEDSTLLSNRSAGFETRGFPGIFFLGARNPTVVRSTLR
jgi:hypothetical protein